MNDFLSLKNYKLDAKLCMNQVQDQFILLELFFVCICVFVFDDMDFSVSFRKLFFDFICLCKMCQKEVPQLILFIL
jgi:hypothetical protein